MEIPSKMSRLKSRAVKKCVTYLALVVILIVILESTSLFSIKRIGSYFSHELIECASLATIFPILERSNVTCVVREISSVTTKPIQVCVSNKSIPVREWQNTTTSFQKYLINNPEFHFIDIGTNLGVYALSAAALGRKVVAVDRHVENLELVAQSVRKNRFSQQVTLVHESIDFSKLKNKSLMFKSLHIHPITADHLIPIIPFHMAVLRIDISQRGGSILQNFDKLFNNLVIPLVLFYSANKSEVLSADANFLHDFMTSKGYSAFSQLDSGVKLSHAFTEWSWNMVWKKRVVIYSSPSMNFKRISHLSSFKGYPLRTMGGTVTIYGYDQSDFITNSIMKTMTWEPQMMASIGNQLKRLDQGCALLDIGTNIGVYALLAAKLGCEVVAVDANVQNLMRLRKSLIHNNLDNKVTLIWNAIDSKYGTVKMKLYPGNVGGSFVVSTKSKKASKGTSVESITIDDLLQVINFKKAIMKYDIEGKEYDGLLNASRLFEAVHFPYVFMEWGVILRYYEKNGGAHIPNFIINFFTSRGYQVSKEAYPIIPLHKDFHKWPWDIVWIKKTEMKTFLGAKDNLKRLNLRT